MQGPFSFIQIYANVSETIAEEIASRLRGVVPQSDRVSVYSGNKAEKAIIEIALISISAPRNLLFATIGKIINEDFSGIQTGVSPRSELRI
jgi:hypothetical protein